jgi:hypothetical protein
MIAGTPMVTGGFRRDGLTRREDVRDNRWWWRIAGGGGRRCPVWTLPAGGLDIRWIRNWTGELGSMVISGGGDARLCSNRRDVIKKIM